MDEDISHIICICVYIWYFTPHPSVMQQHSGYLRWPRVECIGFQTAITLSGLIARGRIKINKSSNRKEAEAKFLNIIKMLEAKCPWQ